MVKSDSYKRFQGRRACVACALLTVSEVLPLDEPFTGDANRKQLAQENLEERGMESIT